MILDNLGLTVLQWGRVLMNAETPKDVDQTAGEEDWLQWGRVLMNAETPKDVDQTAGEEDWLQWGRVLMNAETRDPSGFRLT